MACPKCGCKVTYQYDPFPDFSDPNEDYLERCAHCGEIFDSEFADDDDEEGEAMNESPSV
jgi:hypothetical protein